MKPPRNKPKLKAAMLAVVVALAGVAALALLFAYFFLGHWIEEVFHYVYHHYAVIPVVILGLLVVGVAGAYVLVIAFSWFAFRLLYTE